MRPSRTLLSRNTSSCCALQRLRPRRQLRKPKQRRRSSLKLHQPPQQPSMPRFTPNLTFAKFLPATCIVRPDWPQRSPFGCLCAGLLLSARDCRVLLWPGTACNLISPARAVVAVAHTEITSTASGCWVRRGARSPERCRRKCDWREFRSKAAGC